MRKTFRHNLITTTIFAALSFSAVGEEVNDSGIYSSIDLSFRYRLEIVDQDRFIEDAQASTVRTRATIKTNWSKSIDTIFEFDDVTAIGLDDYNSGAGTSPDKGQYPVIADPVGTEVNQAFIRYTNGENKFAIGRQRINIANQRFVGGVAWRQNEQTYDSFTYNSKLSDKLDVSYSYVFNVNRIFGETVDAGDHTHNTHLLNADYKIDGGKFSGYIFSIDNEDAAVFSSDTFGVRYSGNIDSFDYIAEFATQSSSGDNPNDYNANYYLLDAKYNKDNFTLGIALEVLGGDIEGGQAFTTSLATLHAFQGWADVFLATPIAGIKDVFANAAYNYEGYKLMFVYHDFSTDEGGDALGTEFDFSVSKKFNNQFSGLLKFASFDSEHDAYGSRNKVWLMVTFAP